jgi:hypothetical protein
MIDAHYTNDVHVKCDSDLGSRSSLLGKMKRVVSFFRDRESSERHNHSLTNINDKICNTLRPVVNNGVILRDLKDALIRKQMRDELSERKNKDDPRYLHKNIKTIRRMNRRKLQKNAEDNDCEKKIHDNVCHIDNKKNMKDYEYLYFMKSKPILQVDKFIHRMNNEDYVYLKRKLEPDFVSKLTTSLIKLKHRANKNYKIVIDVYINIIEMIFLNISLTTRLTNALEMAEQYKGDSEILRNREKLKEYIENLKTTQTFIKPVNVNVRLRLKKRYRIYVDRYGFPKNNVFDPELMLDIDRELENCHSDSSDSD